MKTLKDIMKINEILEIDGTNIHIMVEPDAKIKDLKELAIEWYKKLEKKQKDGGCFSEDNKNHSLILYEFDYETSDMSAVMSFIVYFFDLSKDDLE